MAHFSNYDTFICILSLITYIADAITDVLLIIFFFIEGHAFFGSLSLCFVAVAALVMQVFSFHWHVTDRNLTWKNFIIHILFLAPLHRYVTVLRLGFKSRNTEDPEDLGAAYRGLNDISILRLVETFFESAPQLVLQLYIITSDIRNVEPLVGISCLFSFLSVAWAVTAYTDAQHLAYKKLYKRSTLSLITHTTWQTGMIASRVCAIVLFMTVFHSLVAIPLALHAVAMMVWIAIIKPEFGSNSCEKGLFIFAAAIIHVFCFLNLKDGKSRWRILFYYTVCFVENAVLVCLWYSFNDTDQPSWMNPAGFTAVFGGFMIGALSLFVYYCCCHPSGPAPMREDEKPTLQRSQSFNQKETTANKLQPVFNVSNSSQAFINLWLSASLDLTKGGLVQDPNNYLDTNLHTSHDGEGDFKKYGYHGNHIVDYNATGVSDSHEVKESVNSGNNTSLASRNESRNRTLDRSDFSAYNASNAEQYSLPSYNIIEMFSQCKQDPTSSSFNSTLSLNKSGENTLTYDSNYHSGTCGERSSSREQQKSYLSSKPSSRRRQNDTSPVILDSMEFSPIQISPLDPYKLLEETQLKNMTRSNEGLDFYQIGSDGALNSNNMESTPIFHIKPDAARGITRLSLSYSALNTEDGVCPQSAYRKCYDYSSEASSFLQSRHKDSSPLYANKALRKSEELTFSNMSLPLPDGSQQANRRRSTQSIEHHPSQSSLERTRLSGNSRPTSRRISPLSNVIKNRSVDSFYTTSPVEKQLSYLSDRGLSTSDQILSLSGSTTNRSHRSLTSSGFQSEESNFSSPSYGVHVHTQFQSTPILENEISIIKEVPSTLRVQKHRESLDADVFAIPPHVDNSTPMLVNGAKASLREKRRPFPSALMYCESLEQIESPTLPPLTVSSRRSSSTGSGNSSRFFKDLTENGEHGSQGEESLDSSVTCSKSVNSSRRTRYSTNNEQSSLSALLSDGSSSCTGNVHSSDGTISVSSESEKDGLSLPYIPVENYEQLPRRRESDLAVKFYENIENFPDNTAREICGTMEERLPSRTHPAETLYANDMYIGQISTGQPCESRFGAYPDEHQSPGQDEKNGHSIKQNSTVEEESPDRLGQNVNLFNRDKWRSSLDKESQERFVIDIEKLAPKKLYQLRAKNDANTKKRLSPVTISEYNDSPYKFRRPADNQSDYVNIDNVSPASLGSAYEHVHTLTPGVYSDYENVYNLNRLKTGKCPIVRPESLSDSILLDEQIVNCNTCPSMDTIVSEPCSSHIRTVRSPLTSLDTRGVNSPINTSGVNSAFKPVKPKGSVDNQTYTFNGSGNSTNSVFSDSSSSIKSPGSNVPVIDGMSFYENKSGSQSISQSISQSTSTSSSVNKSQPIHSRESSDDSVFPWSATSDSRAPSLDVTGLTPVNYLKLAGRAPLSFSVSSYQMDDRSSRCSSHSYSNSIPWEDSENISSSNQSNQERSGSARQPLRSLENTPVFSPIYGMDNTRDLELISRKRFMSTPKLSTGSDYQFSKTPTGSTLNPHTPCRRVSSGYKNKTFSNDTSTWSSQSVSSQEWALEDNERSSLSKTTYI